MTWENILKATRGKQRQTNRIIYTSAKGLIDDFIEGKDSFIKHELIEYIKDNLLERVKQDGELVKIMVEMHIPRRVKGYLEKMNTQAFHTYAKNKGYRFLRVRTGGEESGKFERISKAKLPAVKTQKYKLYEAFIKKILKDEGGAAGMKNFTDAGNMINGFDKKFLNYVISDALDHENWLAEHEHGDFYLKE